MLKTLSTKSAKPKKGGAGVDGDSRAGCDKIEINRSRMDNVESDEGKVRDEKVGKKVRKTSKSQNLS